MKKVLLLIFVIISVVGQSQTKLSSKATISVITCGPYQGELYSAFGHTAIRVIDPELGFDIAYNYGVFDFNQPNFYLNFTRGFLYYKLGIYSYPDFRDYYISYNRYVHEQVLHLDSLQKQNLFFFLTTNSLPKNQTYRYDYFYNNCSSKVRDVLAEVFKDQLKFDGSFIKTDYTIRNLTDIYLQQQPWGDLGIDICLGLPMDKKASPYEYMFLPDYVESSLDHAVLNEVPIVEKKIVVYESSPEKISFHWYHPWIVFGIIFLSFGFLSYRDWKQKKLTKWIDGLFFGVLGLLGWLLLLLWIATDHKAAANNFNLLWAFPLHLVAAIGLLKKNPGNWLTTYFKFTVVLTSLLIGFWALLPQQLNSFLLPIAFIILMRALVILKIIKR
jgi:hypothetical protein